MINWIENLSQLVSGRLPVSQATYEYYSKLYWDLKVSPASDPELVHRAYEYLVVLGTRLPESLDDAKQLADVNAKINAHLNSLNALEGLRQHLIAEQCSKASGVLSWSRLTAEDWRSAHSCPWRCYLHTINLCSASYASAEDCQIANVYTRLALIEDLLYTPTNATNTTPEEVN